MIDDYNERWEKERQQRKENWKKFQEKRAENDKREEEIYNSWTPEQKEEYHTRFAGPLD